MEKIEVQERLKNGKYDDLIKKLINNQISVQLIEDAIKELNDIEKIDLKKKWLDYMNEESNFMGDEIDNMLADVFKADIANKL